MTETLRAALGDAGFEAARADGRHAALERIVGVATEAGTGDLRPPSDGPPPA
jgi:hypothetical protein